MDVTRGSWRVGRMVLQDHTDKRKKEYIEKMWGGERCLEGSGEMESESRLLERKVKYLLWIRCKGILGRVKGSGLEVGLLK